MSLVDACEYADVHRIATPRARKQYQCQECGGVINPGDTYRRDFTVIMGESDTFICCQNCDDLISRFFAALNSAKLDDFTFEIGGLRAAIRELYDDYGVAVEGFDYPPTLTEEDKA